MRGWLLEAANDAGGQWLESQVAKIAVAAGVPVQLTPISPFEYRTLQRVPEA